VTAGVSTLAPLLHSPWPFLAAAAAGAVAYLSSRPTAVERATQRVALEICPWGVFTKQWVPWRGVDQIAHTVEVERRRTTNDFIRSSVVRVRVNTEYFAGKRLEESVLEALDALLPIYKSQSSMPFAVGVDATSKPIAHDAPSAFRDILASSRAFLNSPAGRELTESASGSYREETRKVKPQTTLRLSQWLIEKPHKIDPAPFAAIIAAELDVRETIDELLALTMSPHPLVAAVARASANRMGVHPSRSFPIEETVPFLDADDLAAIRAWASETKT
jgi:hypothetical protein